MILIINGIQNKIILKIILQNNLYKIGINWDL